MSSPKLFTILTLGLLIKSEAAEFSQVEQKNRIQSPAVTEASGLAVSPTDPKFMWVINDSDNAPEIHLLNIDGTDRGKVKINNAKNIDWEDLASFTLDGKAYLLVADTGDNDSVRKSCTLHILREPALPSGDDKLDGKATTEWHIDFTYEGGPRDCESVGVDAVGGKIILLSKRTIPPEVYELPLRASEKRGTVVITKIGQTSVTSPAGTAVPYANQPVGLSISEDRSVAAVVTYYGVFLFPRNPKESWTDAFSHKPTALKPHGIGQAESVALSKDGSNIYVVAEGDKSPIVCYGR